MGAENLIPLYPLYLSDTGTKSCIAPLMSLAPNKAETQNVKILTRKQLSGGSLQNLLPNNIHHLTKAGWITFSCGLKLPFAGHSDLHSMKADGANACSGKKKPTRLNVWPCALFMGTQGDKLKKCDGGTLASRGVKLIHINGTTQSPLVSIKNQAHRQRR